MNIGTAYNKLRAQPRDTAPPDNGVKINPKFIKYLEESIKKPPVTGRFRQRTIEEINARQAEAEEEASED